MDKQLKKRKINNDKTRKNRIRRFKIFIDFIENNEVFKAKVKAKLIAKGRNPDVVFKRAKKYLKQKEAEFATLKARSKLLTLGKGQNN